MLMTTHKIRGNVRVKFDNPCDLYPHAHLEFKIKLFLCFYRWVEVGSTPYYCSVTYQYLTPSELVSKLKKQGIQGKSVRNRKRVFNRQLKQGLI